MNKLSKNKIWGIGIVAVLAGLIIWSYYNSRKSLPVVNSEVQLPGIQTTQDLWSAEIKNLRTRLVAIGLPALSSEGSALHTHQHLDIFINGKSISVPAGIGVSQGEGFISDIHTHDTTSVIHVESPTIQIFTLGQFFDIWGVRFNESSIGGYIVEGDKKLKVFVNGVPYLGDPREVALDAHQEIVVTYGTDLELPVPIPSGYQFTAGL